MFLCPSETPEGQSIGIVLNLSLLTKISEKFSSVLVKEVIENCENITLLDHVENMNDVTKVFSNGLFLGITTEPFDLMEEIKAIRSVNMLPYDVSFSYDEVDEEINIFSDEGRLLRPVFTTEDGKLKIKESDGIIWDELIEKKLYHLRR